MNTIKHWNKRWELYNIGWHWGLYENILHASWWYSTSRYGEVNIIMTSAVYSHTTRNKAIQYCYYYYIIWSWLCSEILLLSHVHCLCKLTNLTTVINNAYRRSSQVTGTEKFQCIGLPTPFSQIMVASYITTIVKHLYIAWPFLYSVISMNCSL